MDESISDLYRVAKKSGKRLNPDDENILLCSPKHAYLYAKNVLKSRDEKCEQAIFRNAEPLIALQYIVNVAKCRIDSFERLIAKDLDCSIAYIKEFLKDRFYQAERIHNVKKDFYIMNPFSIIFCNG